MSDRNPIASPLQGKLVAVPESRQLDILAELFERRGATVLRTPLVTILDSPDTAAVEAWLRAFVANPPSHFIILTGEGLRRLCGFAQRAGCLDAFVAALTQTIKICRGPKPGRALKELGLEADLLGEAPTTAGIIATLSGLDLQGARIAVQLYGEDPNQPLQDFLRSCQLDYQLVAPYIYAPQSDTQRVLDLLERLAAGEVDVIAFTSQAQFTRLKEVARQAGREGELLAGLRRTRVAAVGPVVAEQLKNYQVSVAVMPADSFFMKPLVREIEKSLS